MFPAHLFLQRRRQRWLAVAVLLTLALLGSSAWQPTPAQSQGDSQPPERIQFAPGATSTTLQGTVSTVAPQRYVFFAFAGQTYQLSPSVAVTRTLTPSGQTLSTASSNGVRLPESGDYVLEVYGTSNQPQPYAITLSITGEPTRTVNYERITFPTGATGTTVSGVLPPQQLNQFRFYAFGGQRLLLSLATSVANAETQVDVFAADDGTRVLRLTDGAPGQATLPRTTDYVLGVQNLGTTTFSYTLQITIVGAVENVLQPETVRFEPGTTGTTLSGNLAPNSTQLYQLRAFAGQNMVMEVTSPAFAQLFGPDGQPLMQALVNFNAPLERTGTYVLRLFNGTSADVFPYVVRISITDTPSRIADTERIRFLPGEIGASLFGRVRRTESNQFVLYALAGQQMTVDVEGATVAIVTPSGELVRSGTGALNAVRLPATGDYTLRVTTTSSAYVGYTLDVQVR